MSQRDNRRRGTSNTHSSQGRQSGRATGRSGAGSGGRSRSSYQPRGGSGRGSRKNRGPQFDTTKILIGILAAAVIVIVIVAVVKVMGSRITKAESGNLTSAEDARLHREVTVDGIAITGMSREGAKKAILDRYPWSMKITSKDDAYDVANLLEPRVDALLDEIYKGDPRESYTLDLSGMDDPINAEVKKAAAKWNIPAKNGSISGFDKASGQFTYSGEQSGYEVDEGQMAADIQTALNAKEFAAVIPASGHAVAPEISESQAKKLSQVIGTYTTTTTANKDRNKNIELACDALNGMILQPGQVFSFNEATGERSSDKGYRPAGAYVKGELVEEPGGGVCQVSSTLYNAVVFAGLTTQERHAHSYEPTYVTPGEDAMVSYGGPDMKFVNNSTSAVAIRTSFSDRKLKISIVGIPILEKGIVLSMESKKTAELDAPAPVYEEDQSLQPGVEKVVKAETKGSRWVTNLVTKKDGVVVSDEFLHNSTYRGKPATISRNTSGVVIPIPGETTQGESGVQENPNGSESTAAGNPSEKPQNPDQNQPLDPVQPQTQPQTQPQNENQGPGGQLSPGTSQTLQNAAPGQSGLVGEGPGKNGDVQKPNGGGTGNGESGTLIPAGP